MPRCRSELSIIRNVNPVQTITRIERVIVPAKPAEQAERPDSDPLAEG